MEFVDWREFYYPIGGLCFPNSYSNRNSDTHSHFNYSHLFHTCSHINHHTNFRD